MPMTRDPSTSVLSRSGPAIAVVGLHLVLIYGLVASTGIIKVPILVEPLQTVFIEEPVTESKPEINPVKPDVDEMVPFDETMLELQFEEVPATPTDVVAPASES